MSRILIALQIAVCTSGCASMSQTNKRPAPAPVKRDALATSQPAAVDEASQQLIAFLRGLTPVGSGGTRYRLDKNGALVAVDLTGMDVTAELISRISVVKTLLELRLSWPKSTTSRLSVLSSLPALRSLYLEGQAMDYERLHWLLPTSPVEELYMGSCTHLPNNMEPVAKMAKLRTLSLNKSDIGDDDITCLARSTSIEWLSLSETKITDAVIPSLASMRSLRRVQLDATDVSIKGAETLRRLRPDLAIEYDRFQRTPDSRNLLGRTEGDVDVTWSIKGPTGRRKRDGENGTKRDDGTKRDGSNCEAEGVDLTHVAGRAP